MRHLRTPLKTKLTIGTVTEVEGGVQLPTQLESQKMDSTPVRMGELSFYAGDDEDYSVEDALHEAENEYLRSGSLCMPRIDEDGDNEDGGNDGNCASPGRNINLRSRVVLGVGTVSEGEAVHAVEGDAHGPEVQGSPSQNLRCRVRV
jgi:hypothetical protein